MTAIKVQAFYTRYPHWGAHAGGHQVCRHLDAAAIALSLTPVSDGDEDWPLRIGGVNTALRRWVSRRLSWYKLSDLAAEIRALPRCLANDVDIVHYLDAEHTAQYLPRWLKRRPGSTVKSVATFHQPPELLPELVSGDIVANLDLVLVVSPTQEAFFRQFLPADRVRTILHGVDADFFRPAEHRSNGRAFKCITAGHWMRDWDAVGAVTDQLSSEAAIEFHIVTNRPTGLDGRPNVRVHQNVDDGALRQLYQEADVLFLPLLNATANNSLLEGLGCGLPVVSTSLDGVRAYVGEDAAHLIDRNDPASLSDAILALRADADRRRRMAAAARARAEALAWPRVASQWEQVYATLVTERRG